MLHVGKLSGTMGNYIQNLIVSIKQVSARSQSLSALEVRMREEIKCLRRASVPGFFLTTAARYVGRPLGLNCDQNRNHMVCSTHSGLV